MDIFRFTVCAIALALQAGCATKRLFDRPSATCLPPVEQERIATEQAYRKAQKLILEQYSVNESVGGFSQIPCSLGSNDTATQCQEFQRDLVTLDREYACHFDPTNCTCVRKIMHGIGTVVGTPFVLAFDTITSPIQLIIWMTFRNMRAPSI